MFAHLGRRRGGAVLAALLLVGQNPACGKNQIQRADAGMTPAGPQYELERIFGASALVQEQKECAPSFRARRSVSSASPGDPSADLGGAVGRGTERASHFLSEWVRTEDGGFAKFAGGGDGASPHGRKKHRRATAAKEAPRRLARRGLRSSAEDYGVCPRTPPPLLGRSPVDSDLARLFAGSESPAARARRGVIPLPKDSQGNAPPPFGTGGAEGDGDTSGGIENPVPNAEASETREPGPGSAGENGAGDAGEEAGPPDSSGENAAAAVNSKITGAGDAEEETGPPDTSSENAAAAVNGNQSPQSDSG
ncbi:MAG: hypothetical protein BJ554DRAFT_1014 [Olpidium bornovanus]|uniref:Uncharacterized protein n=1 Tax=Olpidium bornovanus TaxID=278681 RepID=A0A8H8DM00_9FUNG|nr:MAG: hypothetical protein BJ554DRAFT_1014 [Olpidium bornovanus]